MVFKISGTQNTVKFTYIVSNEAVKSKSQKLFSEKFLKNSIKQ